MMNALASLAAVLLLQSAAPLDDTPAVRPAEPAPRKAKKRPQEPPQDDPLRGPPPERAPAPAKDVETVRLRATLEIEYTSNVLRLSEEEIDQVEDGTNPAKFRIDEVDDVVWSPGVEAALPVDLFDVQGLVGLRAAGHVYQNNSILNHPEVGAFLERGGFVLEYTYLHDVYRREYRSLDTGLFESAFYNEHEIEASHAFRVHEDVKLKPVASLRFRDFDSPFNHRDALAYGVGLKGRVRMVDHLEAVAAYEVVINDAFASSGQPDTSYVEHGPELGLVYAPKGWEAGIFWQILWRDYTTDNAAAVDPGHRDREDERHRLALKAAVKLGGGVRLEAEFADTRVDSDRPNDPGATDEETDWERREVLVALRYEF